MTRNLPPAVAAVTVLVVAALALGACGSDGDGSDGGGSDGGRATLPGSITVDGSVLTVPDLPDTLTIPDLTLPDSITIPEVTRN